MKIVFLPLWLLNFREVPQLSINIDVPLLIDEKLNVLIGNSLKNYFTNDVKCVLISNEIANHLRKWLNDLEDYLIEEKNIKRYHDIEIDIKEFLKEINSTKDDKNLFSLNRETRTIEETDFDKPGKFRFKKSRKKEESKDDNLFSCS